MHVRHPERSLIRAVRHCWHEAGRAREDGSRGRDTASLAPGSRVPSEAQVGRRTAPDGATHTRATGEAHRAGGLRQRQPLFVRVRDRGILRVLLWPVWALGVLEGRPDNRRAPCRAGDPSLLYRQTIKAYPQAGGAYLVTRDNFGVLPAQVAGFALLTDYILTVSVSVSAGTAAPTSVYEPLHPYRVPISLFFIVILTWATCAGSGFGRLFAAPTYFFLVMMFVLLGLVLPSRNGVLTRFGI